MLVEAFTSSSGDRLYAVAKDIQAFNGLMSGDIQTGQIIRFPKDVLLPQYQSCQFAMPTPTPVIVVTPTPAPIATSRCPENPDDVNTLLTVSLPLQTR